MTNKDNFSHSATVFPVQDIQKSIEFYTQKLGFEMSFNWEEPISYAVLKKGSVNLHLTKKEDDFIPSKRHCALYVFVHDVDEIYQRCVNQKISIGNVPKMRDYKMKDFDIIDPDGYIITFGNEG